MGNITYDENWTIPDKPEIGYIVGDGIGVDVTPAAMKVIDAAVKKEYNDEKAIDWTEVLAGDASMQANNESHGEI